MSDSHIEPVRVSRSIALPVCALLLMQTSPNPVRSLPIPALARGCLGLWMARASFPAGRWKRVVVHLWIKCDKVKKNSTLMLFLFLFFLHPMLFIPIIHTSFFFFLIYTHFCFFFTHPRPFIFSWATVLCAAHSWALHAAHPFFLQSGWRPSGRAHYFTIFAFTKPEAPPFKQCTP